MSSDESEDEPETVFCMDCGEKISADAKWCPECGASQDIEGVTEESEVDSVEKTSPEEGKSWVSKYGGYIAWVGGAFLLLVGLGSLADGSARGIAAGVISIALGVAFIPLIREKAGIGNLPGIEPDHSSRRNVLTGIGYGFGSIMAIGIVAPEAEDSAPDSGTASTGGTGGSDGDGNAAPQTEAQSDAERKRANAEYVGDDENLIVTSFETVNDGSARTVGVEGIVENISDNNYEYVQIEIGFYDSDDVKLADGLDNTSGLDAHGRWRFSATGFVDDASEVDSFRFEGLTGY